MNRSEYLVARGWVCMRMSRLEEDEVKVWRDPACINTGGSVVSTTAPGAYLDEEEAERRQLDRDAAARDYLEARRPGVVQVVMGAVFDFTSRDSAVDRRRVLLGRRNEACEFPGQWCLPGGKVEPGEGLEEALLRELKEEVGASFRTSDIQFGPTVQMFDPPVVKKRVRIHCFELAHREGLSYAPLDGLDVVQWFTTEEVGALAMTPATREVLRWWARPPLHVSRTRGGAA